MPNITFSKHSWYQRGIESIFQPFVQRFWFWFFYNGNRITRCCSRRRKPNICGAGMPDKTTDKEFCINGFFSDCKVKCCVLQMWQGNSGWRHMRHNTSASSYKKILYKKHASPSGRMFQESEYRVHFPGKGELLWLFLLLSANIHAEQKGEAGKRQGMG